MAEKKIFYFFIEKEFICIPENNLLEESTASSSVYSLNAITINLVEFSFSGELKKKIYKIYDNYSPTGYNKNDMVKLYKEAEQYIKDNFIKENPNKIFLGCVRDDNGTHEYLTKENLKFDCRTDPIHDIFNILKNIYLDEVVVFENKKYCLNDIKQWSKQLKEDNISIPDVVYFDQEFTPKNETVGKIWISNKNVQLEKFMNPLRKLFENNYYETLYTKGDQHKYQNDYQNVKPLLEFIILLKEFYNFQKETIIKSIKRRDCDTPCIGIYEDYLLKLEKYEFENSKLRCLNSLKQTMQINIEFFKDHKTSFSPILFSTQMIEAEKGYLIYNNLNSPPSKSKCDEWFEKTKIKTTKAIAASSEFGQYSLKFEALPDCKERFKIDISHQTLKNFYFFIENEFMVRPDLNFLDSNKSDSLNSHIRSILTINLLKFTSEGTTIYKIDSICSPTALNADEMSDLYKRMGNYVNEYFIKDKENDIFLGCVRDNNQSHEKLNYKDCGFENRTDPVHDIFNSLAHVYLNKWVKKENVFDWFKRKHLDDFLKTLDEEKHTLSSSLPIVGYFQFDVPVSSKFLSDEEKKRYEEEKKRYEEEKPRRIWLPPNKNTLEQFMEPFRYLFNINYFEKLRLKAKKMSSDNKVKNLLDFIILLKKAYNFLEELIDENSIEEYEMLYLSLKNYKIFYNRRIEEKNLPWELRCKKKPKFEQVKLDCIKVLTDSMKLNIDFFKKYEIPFKPIMFSTVTVEAEKGHLKYESFNGLISEYKYFAWFEKALNGSVNIEMASSEFGRCNLVFTSLPNGIPKFKIIKKNSSKNNILNNETDGNELCASVNKLNLNQPGCSFK